MSTADDAPVDPPTEAGDAEAAGTGATAMAAGGADKPAGFTGLPEATPLALTAGSPDDDGDGEPAVDDAAADEPAAEAPPANEGPGDDDPPAAPLGFSGIRPGS